MGSISSARAAAFAILIAVERGQAHSDDLLRGKQVEALSSPDRNLATALVLGVLRCQITLDEQIRLLLKHPNARLDPEILIALRLGAFQLAHMDRIPARAAIDQSVKLAKKAGHRFASGMVNAVLRKFAAAPAFHVVEESAAELALTEGHPAWMVARWIEFYGMDAARAICGHGQSQPWLSLRLASPAVADELAESGVALEPGTLLTAVRTVVSGDVLASVAFRDGRVRLQDEGSQLVAEIAGKGTAILDCCAAPGGKTMILAERNPDARILACETSSHRIAQLRDRLAVYGERIECRHCDVTDFNGENAFDLVLADVPCTGTGTLGRNPEIRHRLALDDLAQQAERQRAILRTALRAVRPGGRIVYSTCSLEPEENEQVIAALLSEERNARVVPMQTRIEQLSAEGILVASAAPRLMECITPEGFLRLLPGNLRTDGFFIAVIEKKP